MKVTIEVQLSNRCSAELREMLHKNEFATHITHNLSRETREEKGTPNEQILYFDEHLIFQCQYNSTVIPPQELFKHIIENPSVLDLDIHISKQQ